MKLFAELVFTNNTKALKPSDLLLSVAWSNLCEKHSKKLSVDAIRLLLSLSYNFSSPVISISSSTVCQLEDPFVLASDAAALFPEEYPEWESLDQSLCERTKDGELILSWDGFVLSEKLKKEINRVYRIELENIDSNPYIHPLYF